MKNETPSQRLYHRYEFMANWYAKKIYNVENYGLERQDIIQELKLRIYYSIKKYGVEWYIFKNHGGIKPMPLSIYLQTVMNNKLKDLYFRFSKDLSITNKLSIQNNNFDYGVSTKELTNISFKEDICIVKGVDLLRGLSSKVDRGCFSMFLKGFPINQIRRSLNNKVDVDKIIKKQVTYLQNFKSELLDDNHQEYYSYHTQED